MLPSAVALAALRALPHGLVRVLDALRAAGGRPYLVGGAVRDALLGLSTTDFDVEVYGLPAERVRDVLGATGRVDAVGAVLLPSSRSPASRGSRGRSTSSLPRRDSKVGPGHRGIVVGGRSRSVRRRGSPPPRLHDQRHALRSSCRRGPRPVTAAGATSRPACFARWTPRRSGKTRCARSGRSSSRPASSSRWSPGPRRSARPCLSTELPSERIFGEIEKLLLQGPAALHRLRPDERLGDDPGGGARADAARRHSAGPGVASGG